MPARASAVVEPLDAQAEAALDADPDDQAGAETVAKLSSLRGALEATQWTNVQVNGSSNATR